MSGKHTDATEALVEAAERAQRAPSLLNTQPWRWRVHDDVLNLYADRSRQIRSIDPDGRLLTLSCGAALHHARAALAAVGHDVVVDRFPRSGEKDHLARVHLIGSREPRPADVEVLRRMRLRRSDRRPFLATAPVPDETMSRLMRAAEAERASLYRVRPEQRPYLAAAARGAAAMESRMEDYQAELHAWTHRDRSTGEGVTAETVAAQVPRGVPLRDFAPGRETLLDPGWGDDAFAEFLIVATSADGPGEWLAAGEATSAVWLNAIGEGLAMSVMSDVVEVAGARALLRSLLDPPGFPQLVLRVGYDLQPTPVPATPRRRAEEVIERRRRPEP